MRALLAVAMLVGGLLPALAASDADFKSAYAAAEAAEKQAGALRNQWLTTQTALAAAKKSGDSGDFDAATAIMGCAPAYLALAVEALADAGVEAGLEETLARELVVETTAGTAELLEARHPADVRRAVASPGGSTEAGLEALDRENARGAFAAAVRASLERMKP